MNAVNLGKRTLKSLLNGYRAEGISVKIESGTDLSYPSVGFDKNGRGFVSNHGSDAIDLLFEIEKVNHLVEKKIEQENLGLMAWELQNAGYTVIPPTANEGEDT